MECERDGEGERWTDAERRCERDGDVSGRRVFGFIPRMEVEDLGSETAFRATLDWFWRSRVPAFPGGRVRSLQVLRDSSLSLSLSLSLFLSVSPSLSSAVRIWIRTSAHRATPRHATPRHATHRSSSALINELQVEPLHRRDL